MNLLPSCSPVRPCDKISLSSLVNDVQLMCRKAIDPYTGRVYSYNELKKEKQLPSESIESPKVDRMPRDVWWLILLDTITFIKWIVWVGRWFVENLSDYCDAKIFYKYEKW